MAQKSIKNGKKTVKKKSSVKSKSSNRGKTNSAKGKKSKPSSLIDNPSLTPVYVISIMVLLTVIAVLADRLFFDNPSDKENKPLILTETVNPDDLKSRITSEENINEKITDSSDENKAEDDLIVEKRIKVYLIRYDERNEKISLSPVHRMVRKDFLLHDALRELLKGPTNSEKSKGILSAIPAGLKIRNIERKNRTAIIDFNSAIEYNANGTILLSRIDQIVYTATQFDTIDRVKIFINGKSKDFIGSDGLSISGGLHRRRL